MFQLQRLIWSTCVALTLAGSAVATDSYPLAVLPPEAKDITDPQTGTSLTFLTSNPADDQNLYYEQRSWLSDGSMILFNSSRPEGGLMAYLVKTRELVRLHTPKGPLSCPTAAKSRPTVFAVRGAEVVELSFAIQYSDDPGRRSAVTASERLVGTIPEDWMPSNTSLSENANGKLLAIGVGGRSISTVNKDARVITVAIRSGRVKEIVRMPGQDFGGHVMFSRSNPQWVSFGQAGCWIAVVNVASKEYVFRHKKVPGEFCTHHCWWQGNLITFCGGFHPQPKEDADVKAIDVTTGTVRIIGKGAWWPEASSVELARLNWWHASADETGHWVAADNWHGNIGIFHAKTTRTYCLTKDHRTYGHGTHPEVGWDREGKQVIFASHMLGNVDVCVATLPKEWQDEWPAQISDK